MKTMGILAAAALLCGTAAHAEPRPLPGPVGATPIEGDDVYRDFHGRDGIARIMDDFVPRITADPRIRKHFEGVNLVRLKLMLTDQICAIVGGPCAYNGQDMKELHANLRITNADFNALAEDLQISMDREKVPFRAQNRLLAKLAPMQRIIVTE